MPTSSEGTIDVTRVWKRFRADRTRPTVKDQIARLTKPHEHSADRWTWVLRDIDFSVSQGESVGIVGSNGAGKSTLLKVLTGVMFPYAGNVDIRGRVGALIEIRGGMHPELTGRENAFIYGTLLGLSRAEVRARFDEIVEFADLSTAIDRQLSTTRPECRCASASRSPRPASERAARRRGARGRRRVVPATLPGPDARGAARGHHAGIRLARPGLDGGDLLADAVAGQGRVDGRRLVAPVLSDYRRAIEDYATDHLSVAGLVRCTSHLDRAS